MLTITNISASNTIRQQNLSVKSAAKNMQKLASGYKINSAADDAAGMTISSGMRARIAALKKTETNIQEGMNLINVADGSLNEITNILQRSNELLIKASNGTNTEEDRKAITQEIIEGYKEIERIIEVTNYNEIPLLSGKLKTIYSSKVYDDVLGLWGELDLINKTDFTPAKPATPASVTLPLNGIKNTNDLIGKSFSFTDHNNNKRTYVFLNASDPTPPNTVKIPVYPSDTLDSALNKNIGSATMHYSSQKPNEITIKYGLATVNDSFSNPNYNVNIPNGTGEHGNKAFISSSGRPSLDEIDSNVNKFEVNDKSVATFTGMNIAGLTTNDIQELITNKITFSDKIILNFYDSTAGVKNDTANNFYVDLKGCTNGKEVLDKILAKSPITNGDYTLNMDTDSTGRLTFELKNTALNANMHDSNMKISEITGSTTTYETIMQPTSDKIDIKNIIFTPGNAEEFATYEVEVDLSSIKHNSSIRINGYGYYFYDSSKNPPGWSVPSNSSQDIDIKGLSPDEITDIFSSLLTNNSATQKVNKSINGNIATINLRSIYSNITQSQISYSEQSYQSSVKNLLTTASQRFIVSQGNGYDSRYMNVQDSVLELDFSRFINKTDPLNKSLNIAELCKTGFTLDTYDQGYPIEYQFTADGTTPIASNRTRIDLSGCITLDDVRAKLQSKLVSRNSNLVLTSDSDKGTIKLAYTNLTTNSAYHSTGTRTFTDGLSGFGELFDTSKEPIRLSGGTKISKSETTIDFSSIKSQDDALALIGSGFRVTCASCPGEYINFIFREGNDPPTPPFSTSSEGIKIQNVTIDVTQANNGKELVSEILRQTQTTLNHYTELRSDPSNPYKLIASDKRLGDITQTINGKPSNIIGYGSVVPGILTEFRIDVDISYKPISHDLSIQAGTSGIREESIIDIRLPALTLDKLGIPIPTDVIKDSASALKRSEEVLNALSDITSLRSSLGATYNTLESAYRTQTNSTLQTETSLSRIMDTDMAKEMQAKIANNLKAESSNKVLSQIQKIQRENMMTLLK